jgi:hypothetical protein
MSSSLDFFEFFFSLFRKKASPLALSVVFLKFLSYMHKWVINSSKVFSSFFDNSIQLDLKFSKSPGRICKTLQTKIKSGSVFSFLTFNPLFSSNHKFFNFATWVETSSPLIQLNVKNSVHILNS